jgi:cytoskeletal protein RodZ
LAQKTVGQVLRAKRAKLDMTLNEAENLTKIQKTYIVALEQDNYDALPGDFYIKAYIKQYAERLDLDSDKMISAYETGNLIDVREPTDFSENYRFVKPSERLEEEERLTSKKNWQHYLPITILGTVAALIVFSIAAVVLLNKPRDNKIADSLYRFSVASKSSSTSVAPVEKSSTPESSSKAVEVPKAEIKVDGTGQALVATTKNLNTPVKVSLSVAAGTSVWVGMTNSDLPEGQVTLNDSTPVTPTLTGNETVLTLGKTRGLTVKVGDTPIDLSAMASADSPSTLTIKIE